MTCMTCACLLVGAGYIGRHRIVTSLIAASPAGRRPWPHGKHRTYSTKFARTENPLSEGGSWVNGKKDGLDWSDVMVDNGLASGTQKMPTGPPFNDSVALLTGEWNADQMVSATVHTVNQQGGDTFEEVELWLRGSIAPHFTVGYEINFRCLSGPETYVQYGYWKGPLNKFKGLASAKGPGLHDGDVVSASIVGNLITVWINGVKVLQGMDWRNHYPRGSPGIGFFYHGSTGSVRDYGFTSFAASDESQLPQRPEKMIVTVP